MDASDTAIGVARGHNRKSSAMALGLTICTWLWGAKYAPIYVERLYQGLQKHLRQRFRFMCLTERDRVANFSSGIERHAIPDPGLTAIKGCFARLRMFDPVWQQDHDIIERLVCLDLDVVITRQLDGLFDRPESLVVLRGANAANPCPFNCSAMMLRANAHPELWDEFSLERVKTIPQHEFPDDQGWIWHRAPETAGWQVGHQSGIYAFHKPGWPRGTDDLPADARMVAFIGWRDPNTFANLPWVRQHWIGVN
jgi:hypothetical protein